MTFQLMARDISTVERASTSVQVHVEDILSLVEMGLASPMFGQAKRKAKLGSRAIKSSALRATILKGKAVQSPAKSADQCCHYKSP